MTRLEEMIEDLKASRKALKKAARAAERPERVKKLSKSATKDATIARLRAALGKIEKRRMLDGEPWQGDAERMRLTARTALSQP